jgi:succinyl-diaminopimelate desuccinylase
LRYERAAVSTDRDHEIVVAVREAGASVLGDWPDVAGVSYFTDASVLQPATNVPTVVFGPGQVDLMHQTDERIEVAQLRAAARTFAAIPRHIVGSEQ